MLSSFTRNIAFGQRLDDLSLELDLLFLCHAQILTGSPLRAKPRGGVGANVAAGSPGRRRGGGRAAGARAAGVFAGGVVVAGVVLAGVVVAGVVVAGVVDTA